MAPFLWLTWPVMFFSHPPPLILPPGGLHLPVWCCCPCGSLQQHWISTSQCQAPPGAWTRGDTTSAASSSCSCHCMLILTHMLRPSVQCVSKLNACGYLNCCTKCLIFLMDWCSVYCGFASALAASCLRCLGQLFDSCNIFAPSVGRC